MAAKYHHTGCTSDPNVTIIVVAVDASLISICIIVLVRPARRTNKMPSRHRKNNVSLNSVEMCPGL